MNHVGTCYLHSNQKTKLYNQQQNNHGSANSNSLLVISYG
ncbi:hypothetical protein BTN50_1331 [Candidatus Enterovibrio altilux]|uniref:Uncharacterized protein n=1 Tax=Candidatus Enterovibrio altilux TaxID=1927128 RepID=A0A291BA01_9GAMM|nr:hypothetical protein BTN50_1331 [Candidatus Enterovibrio luxaltus]